MRPGLIVALLVSAGGPVIGEMGRVADFEWAAELTPEQRAKQHIDDQAAHSGKYSLRYDATAEDEHPTCHTIAVADAFETAEFEVQVWIKLEGEGSLRLFHPGDGRNVVKVIESPTDGWQRLSLHLRANPTRDAQQVSPLALQTTLKADRGQVSWWFDDLLVTRLYQHEIPKTDEPPVIDGDLSDACWNDEAYAGDPYWRMYNKPRDAQEPTHVWCCYDDEHLYVAFRCVTRAPGRLVTKVTEHDGPAWRDDSAEIFFNPSHDHARYYEYIVTPKEVVFDSKWFREGGAVARAERSEAPPGGVWQTDWHYFGEWKCAVEKDAWTAEIALELRSYEERDLRGNPTGYMPLPTGDVAGILFSRNDRVLGEGMSWADCIRSFHEVHQYGHLVGFRPNYTEGYRKYALREIERLEGRWREMHAAAGYPPAIPVKEDWLQNGTGGLPEAIAVLRERAEAERPGFDEWVAIGKEIERLGTWLDRARAALAPLVLQKERDKGNERVGVWRRGPGREAGRRVAPQWGLALASPMEAACPKDRPVQTLVVPKVARITAARGESEPLHIIIILCEKAYPDQVELSHGPLRGPQGTIAPANMRWYRLGERCDLLQRTNMIRLAPGDPIGLWWVVDVPANAAPGVYRGELRIGYWDHACSSLPVELTVHDFALPRQPSLAVSVGLDSAPVALVWYHDRTGGLNAREYWPFAEELLRHRLTPRELLADFTRWAEDGPDFSTAEEMLTRAELEGIRPDALIAARTDQLVGMAEPARSLTEALRHWHQRTGTDLLPTYACPQDRVPEGLAPWQLERSIASIEDAPPTGALYSAAEMLGTWALCPAAIACLSEHYSRLALDTTDLADAAAVREKEVVWRLTEAGDVESVSLRTAGDDYRPIEARMLGWLAYDYRVSRVFLEDPRVGVGVEVQAAASGLLYYVEGSARGTPAIVPPAPSVRLELLREGLEDYEYLHMLNQLNRRLGKIGGSRKHTRLYRENSWLLKLDYRIIKNVRSYTHDPDVVMAWREALARQIERTRDALRRHGEEGLPGD